MGRHTCASDHQWRSRFHPAPSELSCPECGARALPSLGQPTGRRNAVQATEHPALAEAHTRFTQLVCEWPCWARAERPGHRCWGPVDPHHLVPASWLRSTFADLPPDELAPILYEPVIAAPLCRSFHEGVENRSETISWHELDDEAKLFAKRVDGQYPGRPSMLGRLELESPRARKVAAS